VHAVPPIPPQANSSFSSSTTTRNFSRFVNERLINVYDFHIYNNIHNAAEDLQTIKADLIICKEDMPGMRGSQLCNQLKMDSARSKMKFVLMTEGALTAKDMKDLDITMSADDYLAKPFNLQDAVMRFNKLLGLGVVEIDSNLIEGAETRRLESLNSSMTTSTESIGNQEYNNVYTDSENDGGHAEGGDSHQGQRDRKRKPEQ
jgi:Response regulators consisting of a CheY-like receiver domain and a winged-helix DNA-binding domain